MLSFGETIDITLGSLDEAINHHPTPWDAVNKLIGGLRPGALYVVGARPSVGKSVIALNLAKGLTAHGSVAFSSLEMSNNDVQIRAVSDLRVGDVVEIRTWDTVHCRGEVDAVCPRLGVLWVLDGRLRDRMMVEASGHTVWRLPR